MLRFDWRATLRRLIALWRGSLQLRIVALTLVLSALAVTAVGGYVITSVQANLFDQNRERVVAEAGRAALAAQGEFTRAEEAGATDGLEAVQQDAYDAIRDITSARLIAMLRVPGQGGQAPLIDLIVDGFDPGSLLSSELRATVSDADQDVAAWQSIALPTSDGGLNPGHHRRVVAAPARR